MEELRWSGIPLESRQLEICDVGSPRTRVRGTHLIALVKGRGSMKGRIWYSLVLAVGLLIVLDSAAFGGPCGLSVGDRVELVVDHPDWHPTLWKGMRGTVICFDEIGWWQPVLVSWDGWTAGHDNIWFCTTSILPHRLWSCWWVYCSEIRSLPLAVPDLLDAGEQDRYFVPQAVRGGEPGQEFEVGMRIENGGTGDSQGTVYVDVYASPDPVITESDFFIGNANCWLSAGGAFNLKIRKDFPTNIPPGLYYIGWIIDPDDKVPDELDEANNVVCMTSYRLTVQATEGVPALQISAARGGQIVAPGEGVFACDPKEVVSVEAEADPNGAFLRWIGSAVDAGKVADPYAEKTKVTVDEPYTLTAVFDGPHLMLDDFESYEDPDNPLNRAWIDGVGYLPFELQGERGNGTDSVVGYAEEPTPGNPTVHGGTTAMIFGYDNNYGDKYSEVERRWDTLQNWTGTGANTLSIWYRGAAENAAQPLYVALADCYDAVAVVEHPDGPAAVQADGWNHWTIPLSQFEDAGVMLSRIVTLYIGVGNRSKPKTGGGGLLYFDDITLILQETD